MVSNDYTKSDQLIILREFKAALKICNGYRLSDFLSKSGLISLILVSVIFIFDKSWNVGSKISSVLSLLISPGTVSFNFKLPFPWGTLWQFVDSYFVG